VRIAQNETTNILTTFPSVSAVTIDVYKLTDDSLVVDNQSMTEVANSGTYKYLVNETVANKTEYLWIASDGTSKRKGKLVVSGYMDDKTGFELKTTEHTAIATKVEQSILNDGDGEAVLNAIVGAIGNQNIDQVAIVGAIRADLERAGGKIDSIPKSLVDISAVSTLSAGDVLTALTTQGYTNARASLLDHLDANVSNAGGGLDESGLHTALNSYTNKADWKEKALVDEQSIANKVLDGVLN